MADETGADRKSQLIFELERSRSEFARSMRGVRRDLNVTARLKRSVAKSKLAWLAGAAIGGLVLTRLLFRKKKAGKEGAETRPPSSKTQEVERAGVLLSVLGLLVTLFKPAVTNLITRKLASFAAGDGHIPAPRQYARR